MKMAAITTTKVREKANHENEALLVLQLLQVKCLYCNKTSCTGEECIGTGLCYRCGGKHRSKSCNVNFEELIKSCGGGCWYCLDVESQRDYQNHDPRHCGIKR